MRLVTVLRLSVASALVATSMAAAQTRPAFQTISSEADAARQKGDIPHAIELYSQALQLNPGWAEGWWYLGSLDYGTGAYAAGRDALSHYLQLNADASPALALRGMCEFETGEYPQALSDIQHAIAAGAANQPHNEQILRYHEGLLLSRVGRFDDALKTYGFFAQKGISSPELFTAIGLAGLHVPLLPKEVQPEQEELLASAGKAAFEFMAGDEAGAAQAFQDCFHHFPAAPNLHYFYGTLLYSTDPDSAIEQFKTELQVNPDNPAAQVMLPWSLLMRNDARDALPYARQVAAQQPQVGAAQLVLGRALAETGSLAEGIQHLQQALRLEPNNLEIHIALAKAYSRSGRDADARRERLLCLRMTEGGTHDVAQR